MALALAEAGAEFRLLYACRSRQDLAFGDELTVRLGDRLQVFIDEEGGRVDLAAEIARLAPGGEFYVCGPIGLLEATKRQWQDSGRPVDGLRFETFGNSGRFATAGLHREDPAPRPGDRPSRATRPCSKRWKTPGSR